MKSRISARRLRLAPPEPDCLAQEQIEFVLEDEEDEPCGESPTINLIPAFPALQEYLQDIYDLDAQAGRLRRH